MRVAVIRNGVVENIILARSAARPPKGVQYIEVPTLVDQDPVSIGWEYSNESFIAPPPEEPTEEELLEMRVAQKEQEILRRMAVEELEAEKERG